MFSAAPARASLVEPAKSTGRALRRWLFAAMVTGPSAMEWESFARVFPVHGAIISRSSSFLGPMGSTSSKVVRAFLSQMLSALARKSFACPNRLSVAAEASEKMGMTSCSLESCSKIGKTLEYVQNEPQKQKPIFKIHSPSTAAGSSRQSAFRSFPVPFFRAALLPRGRHLPVCPAGMQGRSADSPGSVPSFPGKAARKALC